MLAITALISLLPFLGIATAAPFTKRDSSKWIQSNRDGLCITPDVASSADIVDGTAVVSKPCTEALTWDIELGSGSVILHTASGASWALDAGLEPGNNGALKVWTSYPGSPQQTWYLTDDNRIALTGGNQCLDEGDNGIQTYQCTTGNDNQAFVVHEPSPSGSNLPTSTTTSSSASEPTKTYPADDPCYGTGGDIVTYTSNGVVTSSISNPGPACPTAK